MTEHHHAAVMLDIQREADRAIRAVLSSHPDHQYEVLQAFGTALIGRSYALGEECATSRGRRVVTAADRNRYLLFAGDNYYPATDCRDFVEAHDTLEAACAAGKRLMVAGRHDWWCVFDAVELCTVQTGRRR